MKENHNFKDSKSRSFKHNSLLLLLIFCALILVGRLAYTYVSDAARFPVNTVKVAASYEHVTHKELESILAKHLGFSFFSLPVSQLQNELNNLTWVDSAYVERVWPDTLKIKLVERQAVAVWGDALMTKEGKLFNQGALTADLKIPHLQGPQSQQLEVLQVYEKLSKILSSYGIYADGLHLRNNHTWILSLGNGAKIYLGKKELEERLLRFCKAYPAVFAQKVDQLASVDLRYPRGMAVQWKQQTGR